MEIRRKKYQTTCWCATSSRVLTIPLLKFRTLNLLYGSLCIWIVNIGFGLFFYFPAVVSQATRLAFGALVLIVHHRSFCRLPLLYDHGLTQISTVNRLVCEMLVKANFQKRAFSQNREKWASFPSLQYSPTIHPKKHVRIEKCCSPDTILWPNLILGFLRGN